MKRVLITGGSGFIAKNIILYLESNGYDVWYITRKVSVAKNAINADITDELDLNQKINLKQIDAIIHVAAHIPVPENKAELDLCQRINFDSTNLLLRFCVANEIKRFIYISSLSIFDSNKEKDIFEDTVPNPNTDYSNSKLSAEYLCRFYSRKYSIHIPILRLGTIFGPGMKTDRLIPYFIRECLANNPIDVYSPDIQINVAYIRDVVKVIEALLNVQSSIFHFTTESLTKIEIVKRIGRITGSFSKITTQIESYKELKNFSIQKINAVLGESNSSFFSFDDGIRDYLKYIE